MSLRSVLKSAGAQFERPDFDAKAKALGEFWKNLSARPARKHALYGIAKTRELHEAIVKYWMDAEKIVQKSGDSGAMATVRKAREICRSHDAQIRSLMKAYNVAEYQCSHCGYDSDEPLPKCPQCGATTLNPDAAGQNNIHANLEAAAAEAGSDFDLNREQAQKRIDKANRTQKRI